jgi:hypothetical protein
MRGWVFVKKKIGAGGSTYPANNLTTLFELYYGIKPDYRTLYQWGCLRSLIIVCLQENLDE